MALDDDALDLSPREAVPAAQSVRSQKRRWKPALLLVVILVFGGVVVTKFLSSAIDYYCNVDEIGSREGCTDDRRVRVQGIVEQYSVKSVDGSTEFSMTFNAEKISVRYLGDPGGVFQECIPVVAHGRVVNGVLESDRIEVKHSNQYV